jgi:hypothetical protein
MHAKCMSSFLKSIVVSMSSFLKSIVEFNQEPLIVCSMRLCIVINIKVDHSEHNLFVQLQFFLLSMIL